MAWYRCGGGAGLPASLKAGMNNVLNKKFGTVSQDYPPNGWPDDVNLMGLLEEKTQASAPVCSFDDGADDVPTKSLVVTIPPTLSGVSSVTVENDGNLCEFDNYNVEANTNTTVALGADLTLKKGTYTLAFNISDTVTATRNRPCYVVNGNYTYADSDYKTAGRYSWTFTLADDTTLSIRWWAHTVSANITISNFMLTYGSTAHAYEPYQTPTVYTASLGRTIYGGTADIVNGTGTEQYQKVKVSDLTWQKSTASGKDFFIANISEQENTNTHDVAIDITGLTYAGMVTVAAMNDKSLAKWLQSVRIYDTSVSTVSDLLSTYGNGEIVFYLKDTEQTDFAFTGQEINTRLGYNAFWSDEGDTDVTYRSSGTTTPIVPTLISKTITENGTYSAEDDGADGYDEVTVNVSGGSCERLLYLHCVNNDQIEIPAASSITQGAKYSQYVSYDSTTKKFTVLQDFTAIIIAWVYTYQTYESSRSDGAIYINNSQVAQYEASGTAAGSTGGVYLARNFKQNDTFNVYTPTRDGYPQQNLKIYLLAAVPDNIYTFTDENA